MDELTVQLSANKYHDVSEDEKEARVRNKFNDALMEKYKQGLVLLKTIDPAEPMLAYYNKAYKKAKRSKHFRKHKGIFIGLAVFILGLLLLIIGSSL